MKDRQQKLNRLWILFSLFLTGCLLLLPVVSLAQMVSFGSPTNFPAGSYPVSVVIGDLNGDGKLDLVAANSISNNVSVLLGNGSGSFGPPTNFATGNGPQSVSMRDLNGDGKLDLVVANHSSNTISILLGNGTGSFGSPTNFSVGIGPYSVAIGDLNADGKLDLAVANFDSDNVSVLLGDGVGSFGPATNFPTGDGAESVAIGDLNGDGKLDLAVTDFYSNTVSVLLGDGAGSFGSPTHFTTGNGPDFVAMADLNGDGKLDLAMTDAYDTAVSVLLGNGSGSFGPPTNFSTGNGPQSVAIGDLDGDGKLDLAVANYGNNTVSILLGNGTGSFGSAINLSVGSPPPPFSIEFVAIGDLNGDGKPDLAVANSGSNSVSILLNTTTLGLINISTRSLVLTGNNVMIGGFYIGGATSRTVIIRARGPSMSGAPFNVPGTLSNPTMQLYSGSTVISQNNDWQTTDPLCSSPAVSCGNASQIMATGLDPCEPNPGQTSAPPGCTQESAILVTLPPGGYTAIVSGVGGTTGVGLVEVFQVQ